jgi:hypothetical protein
MVVRLPCLGDIRGDPRASPDYSRLRGKGRRARNQERKASARVSPSAVLAYASGFDATLHNPGFDATVNNRLAWIIQGGPLARRASEGPQTGYPRLRFGLVWRHSAAYSRPTVNNPDQSPPFLPGQGGTELRKIQSPQALDIAGAAWIDSRIAIGYCPLPVHLPEK